MTNAPKAAGAHPDREGETARVLGELGASYIGSYNPQAIHKMADAAAAVIRRLLSERAGASVPSEKATEAALKAWRQYWSDNGILTYATGGMITALTAAYAVDAPSPPPSAGDVAGLVTQLNALATKSHADGNAKEAMANAATALVSIAAERDAAREKHEQVGALYRSRVDYGAKLEAERDALRKERDELLSAKANAREYAKWLLKYRDMLHGITDELEDEGDRIYFGSSNHADQLREISEYLESLDWDRIMRDSVDGPDIYASLYVQQERAKAAEARTSDLAERLDKATEIIAETVEQGWLVPGSTLEMRAKTFLANTEGKP